MNKYEVQKRVLNEGEPLPLEKFTWDKKTRTFSSLQDHLVFNFSDINSCNFIVGDFCVFYTGDKCSFNTKSFCTFYTSHSCNFNTDCECTFNTWDFCTFKTDAGCTFYTDEYCTFNTGRNCTFNTGSHCNFNAAFRSNIKTGKYCVIRVSSACSVESDTGSIIIHFKPEDECCTQFKTNVIYPETGKTYQTTTLNDYQTFLVDGISVKDGKRYIIVDNLLSRVLNQKGNVYKVFNDDDTEPSYIIQQGDVYSHGETLKEARDSLKYKISDRDTSGYENLALDSVLTLDEAIKCYRAITGACEYGVRKFVDNLNEVPDKLTIQEMIDITYNYVGNKTFKKFFFNQQQQQQQ